MAFDVRGVDSQECGLVHGRQHKRYQCCNCRHQAIVTAGTIMEATKLPLTLWFIAFYLISHALVAGFRVAGGWHLFARA